MLKEKMENVLSRYESPLQRWPQVNFLRPNSLNLVCDASTAFRSTLPNRVSEATVANAIIHFNPQINDFAVYSSKPIIVQTINGNFSELVSIGIGVENLVNSGIKSNNHNILNIFTDNQMCISKLRPIFSQIQQLRFQGVTDPIQILQSFASVPLDPIEYTIIFHVAYSGLIPYIFHIKAHTSNLNYISKDFLKYNGMMADSQELIYISSVHSMVDSLTIKITHNTI